MSKRRTKRGVVPVYSLWIRWVAALCLSLIAVVGTAQATHIHGDLLPHAAHELHLPAADAQSLGGEEHCPLCVAMHSAMPVQPVATYPLAAKYVAKVPEQAVSRPETLWHFARFGRPPPIQG